MLKGKGPPLAIAMVTFLLVLFLQQTNLLELLELKAYDLHLKWSPKESADDRVVIIGETEQDLRRFGHPLPDPVLATAINTLNRNEVRVIGIDKYRDIPVPGKDGSQSLNQTLKHSPNVVWIFKFAQGGESSISPPELLRGGNQVGFNDLPPDSDGVMRRGLLFLDDGESSYPSFALNMALRWLTDEGINASADPDNHLIMRIGETPLPPLEKSFGGYTDLDDRGYQFMLEYPGLPNRFNTYSLSDLIDNKLSKKQLSGRIVLLGGMAESLNDRLRVPLAYEEGSLERDDLYGVELQGYLVSQLLYVGLESRPPIRSSTLMQELLWLAIWVLLSAIIGTKLRGSWYYAIVFMVGATALFVITQWAFSHQIWLPLTPPLLGWTICLMLMGGYLARRERNERKTMMQLFSRHVSTDVAQNIWQNRAQLMQEGQLRPQNLTATVLFTDIKGFTSVSERLDSQELMQWLNAYMEAMTGVVLSHHGVINKYIGDAIMVMFGVPFPRANEDEVKEDARNAVACARAMAVALKVINKTLVDEGLPAVAMRIGVYTGPLVAGSLGSADRQEYTVIGDTVNIASRLESYGKGETDIVIESTDCRILIGESTYLCLDEENIATAVGSVKLKGKEEPIAIYQVGEL